MTRQDKYNAATVAAVELIIEQAEKMKRAYFWDPPTKARDRRNYEERNSCGTVEWTEGGRDYTAAYNVECSCTRVYARGDYTRDGEKTTLTAIKNSVKRMTAALEEEKEKEPEHKTFYAVMRDDEDSDWGHGSYDYETAVKMVQQYIPEGGYIAVIDEGPNPVCVDEIHEF